MDAKGRAGVQPATRAGGPHAGLHGLARGTAGHQPMQGGPGSTGPLSRRVGEAQGERLPSSSAACPSPLATPRGQLRPCSQHGPAEKPDNGLAEARPSGARGPARMPPHPLAATVQTGTPRDATVSASSTHQGTDASWGSGYRARGDPSAAVWEQDRPPVRQRPPTVRLAGPPGEAPSGSLHKRTMKQGNQAPSSTSPSSLGAPGGICPPGLPGCCTREQKAQATSEHDHSKP